MPSADSSSVDRDALLRQYGRIYGELGLAIAFTSSTKGDAAKKCTTKGWQDTKPLKDAESGEQLLARRGKRGNPVVVLSQSGLVGVECDTPERLAQIQELCLPETVTVRSSEEYKRHYWFRPPNGSVEFAAFRFEEKRITADKGRYLAVPPAIHPTGCVYGFVASPEEIAIARLTEDAYDHLVRLAGRSEPLGGEERERLDVEAILEGASHGERDESAFKYACSMRARSLDKSEARALMQTAWERMEQPDGDVYPLESALEKVDRAWKQYPAGATKSGARRLPPPAAPLAVARVMLKTLYDLDSTPTLRHWRGGWQEWQRSRWAEVEERTMAQVAYEFTEHAVYLNPKDEYVPWLPNRSRVADLLAALAAPIHLREVVGMPSWLDGTEYDGLIVAVENGLLDVGKRVLMPHTPRFFNSVSVPFPYDPDAPEPKRWLRFLHELWRDDEASIAMLQEWFGYTISGRTDLHKMLLMVGPTRGGKGVVSRVLGALIGRENVAGPTLSSLQKNFGLQPLLGKALAVVSDVRLDKRDATVVVERLLSISGEDLITVDRKYRDPWTGQIPARFMLLSNELPQFGDASTAIANRFMTLLLSQSFLGKEDHGLEHALYKELPGILNWSLDGLARLQEQDAFTRPAATDEAFRELVALASPVSAFVRECCDIGPEHEAPCDALYDAWHDWALCNGHTKKSNSVFGRDLRAAYPSVNRAQRGTGDNRYTVYTGLDLSSAVKRGVVQYDENGKPTFNFSKVRRPK